MSDPRDTIVIRNLGLRDYMPVWTSMQEFTAERTVDMLDEYWIVEHPPVFTLGLSAKAGHILSAQDIPVIHTDRGGQVTYHGPGQIVIYVLIELRRKNLSIRRLVASIEQAVISMLEAYGIDANSQAGAPGVYVDGRKIAALGLRVKHGRTYHGFSFNVDMDLTPFGNIDPCGYEGLEVTQLKELVAETDWHIVAEQLCTQLMIQMNYTTQVDARDRDSISLNI